MSDKIKQNGLVNGADSSEQDNLLKIRDILFGAEVAELSEKIREVEVEFNKNLGSLKSAHTRSSNSFKDKISGLEISNKELVQAKIQSLESAVHKDVEIVAQRVVDLQGRLSELEKAIAKSNSSIEKKLNSLSDKIDSMGKAHKDLGSSSVKKVQLAEALTSIAKSLK